MERGRLDFKGFAVIELFGGELTGGTGKVYSFCDIHGRAATFGWGLDGVGTISRKKSVFFIRKSRESGHFWMESDGGRW